MWGVPRARSAHRRLHQRGARPRAARRGHRTAGCTAPGRGRARPCGDLFTASGPSGCDHHYTGHGNADAAEAALRSGGRGSIWSNRSASAISRRRSRRPCNGETAGTASPAACCGIPTSSGKAPRWPKRWKHCGKPPRATSTYSSPGGNRDRQGTVRQRPARQQPAGVRPVRHRRLYHLARNAGGGASVRHARGRVHRSRQGRARVFSPPPTPRTLFLDEVGELPSPCRARSCGRWSCAASVRRRSARSGKRFPPRRRNQPGSRRHGGHGPLPERSPASGCGHDHP